MLIRTNLVERGSLIISCKAINIGNMAKKLFVDEKSPVAKDRIKQHYQLPKHFHSSRGLAPQHVPISSSLNHCPYMILKMQTRLTLPCTNIDD